MSTSMAERAGEEIWELMVPGRVHVEVTNHRGRPQNLSVSGKKSRLRISTTDREIAQERIREAEHDPFRNGMLRRVDSKVLAAERAVNELSDEDLREVFNLTGDEFEDMVRSFSEVNVRRMAGMTEEVDASNSQIAFLKQYIADTWPIGGTVPSWEEMQQAPL
jgi:hypothetical protein